MHATTFLKNVDRAEKILNVIRIREEIQPLKNLKFRPIRITLVRDFLVRTRPSSSLIAQITKLVDETIEIAIPLLIVFSVSCLERFLREIGMKGALSKMIDDCRQKAGISLTRQVHEIRIKRNIFVHNINHKIEKRNFDDFSAHQIKGYSLGLTLKLDVNLVKKDLSILREFVQAISSPE